MNSSAFIGAFRQARQQRIARKRLLKIRVFAVFNISHLCRATEFQRNAFEVKLASKVSTLIGSHCLRANHKFDFHVVILQNKSMKLTKMRAARAARSFVLFRPIVLLYFGVLSAVTVCLCYVFTGTKKVPILLRDAPISLT